ncbi:hypothetical protein [Streptomyces europaeiscabiei]|uniref:hypothetical protein n=1 Tax=Streptomyces europaeiscabiei TaxID=146819 RepID=UPI0038F6023A
MTDSSASAGAARLLVYVPGLTDKPGDADELMARLREENGHVDDVVWVYPDSIRVLTRGRLAALANTLNRRINSFWTDRGCPQEIVLIGHSAGGVLLRYAYLCGCGRLRGDKGDWVANVRRIVLLAAPNRGVESSRLSRPTRMAVAFAGGWKFAARELLAGAVFMTNLRLEWIRHFTGLRVGAPTVVQVRGSEDPLLEAEDSRDVVGCPNGTELYLPHATHRDVMKISAVREESPGNRYRVLRQAIIGEVEITDPEALPEDEAAVTDIVFLLHGIRAGIGTWVEDLGNRLKEGAEGQVQVVQTSYGWLSAFNFAFPVSRRRTLRRFQDKYSYVVARHPKATIHFVGHSNGTYMLGQSLRHVVALRFNRVYLAGSVLPRDFPWLDLDGPQIGALVNACGAKDKPVAWLCSGLRGFGMRDIGTAGFAGFLDGPARTVQLLNLDGGHGAGLTGERLPDVVQYIRYGQCPTAETTAPSAWFDWLSRSAPVWSWTLLLCVLVGVGATLFWFSVPGLLVVLAVMGVVYMLLKTV